MKRLDIRNMALIAVMTALMCIFGPMSIPIGAVPFSLTPLLVYLAAYILGMRNGTVAYLVYLLIGFVGVPVMSGYSGGPAKILGPTGGYLMAFILMALMTGFVVELLSECPAAGGCNVCRADYLLCGRNRMVCRTDQDGALEGTCGLRLSVCPARLH